MAQIWFDLKTRSVKLFQVEGLPALILMNMILGISYSFVLPFTSLFGIDEVGMSNTEFGVFMTVSAIANVVISTYMGKMSDGRLSRRTSLLICAVAAIAGYTFYAFSRDFYVLLIVSSLLLGVASSAFPLLFALARETLSQSDLPAQETPFYMNLFRTFFALSWTVGPALASYILIGLGFKGLYLLVAASYAIVIMMLFFLKSPPAAANQTKTAATEPPVALNQIIMRPFILGNLIAFTLVSAAGTIGSMNLSLFLTKVLHTGQEQVGVAFSIPPIFEIPFMLFFGILAMRIDNKILIRLGVLFVLLYCSLLWFATSAWEVYAIQILSAAAVSITSGIAITYFQDFIPNMPGVATSLYMNTSRIGSLIAYLVFGFASEQYGYRAVFLICVAFAAVSLLLLFIVGKHQKQEAAASVTT
ncbi:sugar efflux transporter [Paenibacillus kobensis]|uniref:sugar efflux transporter n=1 Tax=Paenibacillus kobensis TaxID=59841 RepID=UPI0013E3BFEC|nr:sugar efflux transporter [Paenibacillus kobensis]